MAARQGADLFGILTALVAWIGIPPSSYAQESEADRPPEQTEEYPTESMGYGSASAGNEEGDMGANISDLEERVGWMEEDMEHVLGVQDTMTSKLQKDKLNWSGDLRITANNFHLTDKTRVKGIDTIDYIVLGSNGETTPVYSNARRNVSEWYPYNWTNRMRLEASYDVGENLRFYTRLVLFKHFNDFRPEPTTLDMHQSRYPKDSGLRIERAYFDWFITDWLVFTAGRASAPEGPPAELKENTERSATWGVQMVEAEMEIAMLTFHMSRILEGTYLRVFYIPFTPHVNPSLSDDLTLFTDGGFPPMNAFGYLLEFSLPGLGDNLWQFGGVLVPKFGARNLPFYVNDEIGSVYPSDVTGNNLGFYANLNTLLEVRDLMGIGLDLFAAYAMTYLNPTDNRQVYTVPLGETKIPVRNEAGVELPEAFWPDEVPLATGLASYEQGAGSKNLGHMIYAGFRYTMPFGNQYAPKIGSEFNWGSKYHISWSSPSDLLVNKLATKGTVFEAYYIQQLVPDHLFARLGYIQLNREYQGLYIGPTTALDQTVRNVYLLVDMSW